jgi:hypothetical protein
MTVSFTQKTMSWILRQPKHTPTFFEIDQIQNIIDIGNWLCNFQEAE